MVFLFHEYERVKSWRDYYRKRPILCIASSKILTPHPLSARRVCPPPPPPNKGVEGGGVNIWKTRDIGLASYSNNLSTG